MEITSLKQILNSTTTNDMKKRSLTSLTAILLLVLHTIPEAAAQQNKGEHGRPRLCCFLGRNEQV